MLRERGRARAGEPAGSPPNQPCGTGSPAEELLTLAAKQAALANLIGYGLSPLSEAGERVRRIERDQATSTLSLALSRGPRDLSSLMANPDFRALFARPEIQSTDLRSHEEIPLDPFAQSRH